MKLIYNGAATISEQNYYYGNTLYYFDRNRDVMVVDAILKKKIYNPFSKLSPEYTISFLLTKENNEWKIINSGKRA